jgi:hypothetical protein
MDIHCGEVSKVDEDSAPIHMVVHIVMMMVMTINGHFHQYFVFLMINSMIRLLLVLVDNKIKHTCEIINKMINVDYPSHQASS